MKAIFIDFNVPYVSFSGSDPERTTTSHHCVSEVMLYDWKTMLYFQLNSNNNSSSKLTSSCNYCNCFCCKLQATKIKPCKRAELLGYNA